MWKILSQDPNWRQDFEFINFKNIISVNFNPDHLKLLTDLFSFWDQLGQDSTLCGAIIRTSVRLAAHLHRQIGAKALDWEVHIEDSFLLTRKSSKEIENLSKQLNELINSPNATSQESQDAIELLNTSLNNEITFLSEKLPVILETLDASKKVAISPDFDSYWL